MLLVSERLNAKFTEEALEAAGVLHEGFGRQARLFLAAADFQFFCRFYLAEHFFRPMTAMHAEVCTDLEQLIDDPDVENEAIAIFRGGGKTTIVSNAFPLWCILFKKRRYIIIIQNSLPQAKLQLGTIKAELEVNERIHEDFGKMVGDKWAEEEILTHNRVLVQVMGAGSQIRGRKFGNYRPDLIVCDDMEDLESVQSETQRAKLLQNLYQSIMPAGDPDRTKFLVVGNYLHYDCMLRKCVESPLFKSRLYRAIPKENGKYKFAERQDLWTEWRRILTDRGNPDARVDAKAFFMAQEEEMLRGAETTYPDLYPYYRLMETWVDKGSETFFTEYLNEPRNPDERFFKYETYKMQVAQIGDKYETVLVPWDSRRGKPSGKTPHALSTCRLFATTDPSMGVSDKGDPSAIIVGAVSRDNRIFILRADIQNRTPYQIIDTQNALAKEYHIEQWGIETVQFQAFFANESAEASMRQGVFVNFTPIKTTTNKVLRMNSLQPDLENGYIMISEDGQDELKKQLDEYPNGSKVDGIDALEMLRTMVRNAQDPEGAGGVQFSMHTFTDKEMDYGEEYDAWKAWLIQTQDEQEAAAQEKRRAEDIPMPEPDFPFVLG